MNRCRIMLIVPSGNINHEVLLIIWCQRLKVKAFPELSPLKYSFCLKLNYEPVIYFTVPASFLRHLFYIRRKMAGNALFSWQHCRVTVVSLFPL